MKVYIAGPMTGYEDRNYPVFCEAAEIVKAAGDTPMNPVDAGEHNDTGEPQQWDWYMRHALRMVLDADLVVLLPGWEQSTGARLEHHVATSIGVPAIDFLTWVYQQENASA